MKWLFACAWAQVATTFQNHRFDFRYPSLKDTVANLCRFYSRSFIRRPPVCVESRKMKKDEFRYVSVGRINPRFRKSECKHAFCCFPNDLPYSECQNQAGRIPSSKLMVLVRVSTVNCVVTHIVKAVDILRSSKRIPLSGLASKARSALAVPEVPEPCQSRLWLGSSVRNDILSHRNRARSWISNGAIKILMQALAWIPQILVNIEIHAVAFGSGKPKSAMIQCAALAILVRLPAKCRPVIGLRFSNATMHCRRLLSQVEGTGPLEISGAPSRKFGPFQGLRTVSRNLVPFKVLGVLLPSG